MCCLCCLCCLCCSACMPFPEIPTFGTPEPHAGGSSSVVRRCRGMAGLLLDFFRSRRGLEAPQVRGSAPGSMGLHPSRSVVVTHQLVAPIVQPLWVVATRQARRLLHELAQHVLGTPVGVPLMLQCRP